jgi:opacity protein-like surface antigen
MEETHMKTKSVLWKKAWIILSLVCPLAAQSQPSRLYLKADVGGNITRDTDLREFFGEDVTGATVKFDPGYRVGIGAGYDICEWFAFEGEIGSMANNIKSITGADSVDAVFANVPFLVNARLQAPKRWCFSPYIGAGVGGSASIIDIDHIDFGATSVDGSDADVVLAFQAFAGFRVALNESMGLGFAYRYFWADRPSWEGDFESDRLKFGRMETHAFSVVFDWHF